CQCRDRADCQPKNQKSCVLGEYQPAQGRLPKTDRTQQRQLATPFPDRASQDDGQTQSPHRQAQTTQGLECLQVSILYSKIRHQALRRRTGKQAMICQSGLERSANLTGTAGWRIDQKESISSLAREQGEEVRLRQKKLTLKNTVLKQSNDP